MLTSASFYSVKPQKILIIEDNQDVRETFQMLLEGEGYAVIKAKNGLEGLNILRNEEARPGMIFLDMKMPVMDGRKFLEEMRNHRLAKDTPVIILAAENEEHELEGVRAWFKKPVELEAVLDAVEKYGY